MPATGHVKNQTQSYEVYRHVHKFDEQREATNKNHLEQLVSYPSGLCSHDEERLQIRRKKEEELAYIEPKIRVSKHVIQQDELKRDQLKQDI